MDFFSFLLLEENDAGYFSWNFESRFESVLSDFSFKLLSMELFELCQLCGLFGLALVSSFVDRVLFRPSRVLTDLLLNSDLLNSDLLNSDLLNSVLLNSECFLRVLA